MLASGSALLAASLVLIARDLMTFRSLLERDVVSLGSIIADNSTAALSFQDPMAAGETLSALRQKPNIALACIYDEFGKTFASYVREDAPRVCPTSEPITLDKITTLSRDRMAVHLPVALQGKTIGGIYLENTLEEIQERLKLQALTLGVVLIFAGDTSYR